MYYLDHNATSPLRPESLSAMTHALGIGGNPSSIHAAGRAARAVTEDAREKVAGLVGARPDQGIFTSGATESNTLALFGAAEGSMDGEASRITRIFISAVEHASVRATAERLAERFPWIRLATLPVTAEGVVELEALRVALREGKGRALVAVMAANNETGVMQPIADVSRLAREAGALLLVDAVPAAGKMKLDFSLCDYMVLSAHKLGGPMGAGALLVADGVPLAPQLVGGGQQRGLRAGAENLAGIAGFMTGPISAVQVGMGEHVLILTFVVIIIGGVGSIKGAFAGALIVGVVDTMMRAFLPALMRHLMASGSEADALAGGISAMGVYLLMAIVLLIKPKGLLPAHG